MSDEYLKRKFTNKNEAYNFAGRVFGCVEGPFYDVDLNVEYIVYYKDTKKELADGVIINGINWFWCLYDTVETAEKVRAACEFVSPASRISDVCQTSYKNVKAFGFRVHK